MSITQIMFFFLSALAVFSAIMVLVSRNPVHSVLWLIAVFFAISGHYILLNAHKNNDRIPACQHPNNSNAEECET